MQLDDNQTNIMQNMPKDGTLIVNEKIVIDISKKEENYGKNFRCKK